MTTQRLPILNEDLYIFLRKHGMTPLKAAKFSNQIETWRNRVRGANFNWKKSAELVYLYQENKVDPKTINPEELSVFFNAKSRNK